MMNELIPKYSGFDANLITWKEKIKTDGREFCLELFNEATIRLLMAKYDYYECNGKYEVMSDITYDKTEKSWYMMGIGLGLLKEDEISPCVDWDPNHPKATEAVEKFNKLWRKHERL